MTRVGIEDSHHLIYGEASELYKREPEGRMRNCEMCTQSPQPALMGWYVLHRPIRGSVL
jgi:hypothetical protein